jgi:hypothetical protein
MFVGDRFLQFVLLLARIASGKLLLADSPETLELGLICGHGSPTSTMESELVLCVISSPPSPPLYNRVPRCTAGH